MNEDPERVRLDPLAPREAWVEGLPALGREVARRRENAGLEPTAWWFVPAAAVVALVCWGPLTRLSPPPSPRTVTLLFGSDAEAVALLSMEAAP
jgi:hypothetical protein